MSAASQGSLGGGAGGCEVTPGVGGTVWVSLGGVCVHMRVCLRRPHGGWLSAQQAVWQMVEWLNLDLPGAVSPQGQQPSQPSPPP